MGIAHALSNRGHFVRVYDPAVGDGGVMPASVEKAFSMEAAIAGMDVIVIATAWDEFRSLPETQAQIIDCWRILSPNRAQTKAEAA